MPELGDVRNKCRRMNLFNGEEIGQIRFTVGIRPLEIMLFRDRFLSFFEIICSRKKPFPPGTTIIKR